MPVLTGNESRRTFKQVLAVVQVQHSKVPPRLLVIAGRQVHHHSPLVAQILRTKLFVLAELSAAHDAIITRSLVKPVVDALIPKRPLVKHTQILYFTQFYSVPRPQRSPLSLACSPKPVASWQERHSRLSPPSIPLSQLALWPTFSCVFSSHSRRPDSHRSSTAHRAALSMYWHSCF